MAADVGLFAKCDRVSVLSQVRHTYGGLFAFFPDRPGYDQRTYECPRCKHEVGTSTPSTDAAIH
jgi:hypothetical protein